jgi:hypothetical protein
MHPLLGSLRELSDAELQEKMDSLYKKMGTARRIGNAAMLNQLMMMIQDHQEEYNRRRAEDVKAAQKNPIFKDSLDIE